MDKYTKSICVKINICAIIVILAFLALATEVTSWQADHGVRGHRQRSDDLGTLQTVVENLSQQVAALSAQVTLQANAASAANAKIASLEDKIASLSRAVAFHAYTRTDNLHVDSSMPLLLETADTNVGGAYSASTGTFTAPLPGLYEFQITFMPYGYTQTAVYAGIFVDDAERAGGVADSRHNYYDQTTVRTIVHLTSGQRVKVKNGIGSPAQFYGGIYTTFSGFLLKTD